MNFDYFNILAALTVSLIMEFEPVIIWFTYPEPILDFYMVFNHVTRFDRLLRRKGDSTALQLIIINVFIAAGQIQNETKIKTSLRARGPPGVSGAYAACVFCI